LGSEGWIKAPLGNRYIMGGGVADHAALSNLTYATAGHTGFQAALTFPLAANLGGTGIANLAASTLTLGAATTITGGGTVALGGFTLTVPATGTAALLATQNVFTVQQMIDGTSDQIQLRVQANATQTANILEIETSGSVDLITVDPSGNLYLATTQMLQFRDAGVFINSATDGHLDLDADISIDANAPLVLVAGTATAGDAPLKFTSGVVLATPEAGAVEFYDDRIYITNVAARKAVDRSGEAIIATTTSTSVNETTIFTEALPANCFKARNFFKMFCGGQYTTHDAADTCIINIKIAGATVATISTPSGTVSGKPWHLEVNGTIRTVGAGGTMSLHVVLTAHTTTVHANTPTTAINTTSANDITVTVQWSDALNSIQIDQGFVEFKN